MYIVYHNGRDSSNNTAQWLISSSRTTVSCHLKFLKSEHELREYADFDFTLQPLFWENVETYFCPRQDCALAKGHANIILTRKTPSLFSFQAGKHQQSLIDWRSVFCNQKIYLSSLFCFKIRIAVDLR